MSEQDIRKKRGMKRDLLAGTQALWTPPKTGHVGTLQTDIGGIVFGLELYRFHGRLFWLWRDPKTNRACYRSPGGEEAN